MFEKFFEGLKGMFEGLKEVLGVVEEKRNNIAQIKIKLEEVAVFAKNSDAKLTGQLSQNSNLLDEINKTIVGLSNNLTETNKALQAAQNKNSELNERLENANSEISEKSSEISKLKSNISNYVAQYKKDTDEKKNLNDRLEEKEASLQACQKENASLSEYKTRSETALSPFIEILKYCYECDAVKKDVIENANNGFSPEFSETDYKNIFAFIAFFGKETTFALTVQTAIKKIKSANPSAITEEEKRLIKRLNSYYRDNIKDCKFDVLDMLGENPPFDKGLMRDIQDQGNPDPAIKSVKNVCVPAYRKGPNRVEITAYIVGEK